MGVLRNGTIFLLALGTIKNKDRPVDFTRYVIDCYIPTYARFSPAPRRALVSNRLSDDILRLAVVVSVCIFVLGLFERCQ